MTIVFTIIIRTELVEWFPAGIADAGKKMSTNAIRQSLVLKYPNRMDIPSEYHITGLISGQMRRMEEMERLRQNGNVSV